MFDKSKVDSDLTGPILLSGKIDLSFPYGGFKLGVGQSELIEYVDKRSFMTQEHPYREVNYSKTKSGIEITFVVEKTVDAAKMLIDHLDEVLTLWSANEILTESEKSETINNVAFILIEQLKLTDGSGVRSIGEYECVSSVRAYPPH